MPLNGSESETDPPPPPINHVLRPHHISLLAVILLTYRRNTLPSPHYLLHIQRILIEEISEVSAPKPWNELTQDLTSYRGVSDSRQEVLSMEKGLHLVPKHLNGVEALHDFFADIQAMVVEETNALLSIFERRSFFGMFCRRCCVSYHKLSFAGLDRLQRNFVKWTHGENTEGYQIQETSRKETGHLLFPTAADDRDYGTAASFDEFLSAYNTGDAPEAVDQLRTFFDQRFSDNNESGLRQHSLLNLALFHYSHTEYVVARKYLYEAITVARTSGDRVTLQHCMSLLRRFVPQEGSNTLPLTEIQPNISATHVVSDIIKIINQTKEPILSSFSRILQAWACYDSSANWKGGPPPEHEQWYIHAVQAFLWKVAGPSNLSNAEESIVLAFTRPGTAREARWDSYRSRAERYSRQGYTEKALAILLDSSCWKFLDLRQYNEWASAVWLTMVTQIIRRGQKRQYSEFFRGCMPNMEFDVYDAFSNSLSPPKGQILSQLLDRDALLHAKHNYKDYNALAAIQALLRSLFASEFRGHWSMYRIGVIMLADLAGDFGMRKYGKRTLQEIMPQLMAGDDIETRAFGCFVLARCIVLSSGGKAPAIKASLSYLERAERDYASLEMYTCQQDVLYLMASVYNTLGMIAERDAAAARHAESTAKAARLAKAEIPPEIIEIWTLVTEVGARIAAGSSVRSIS